MVEQLAVNQFVASSNLARGANQDKHMKYKDKKFPFWGYHKYQKILYRFTRVGKYGWYDIDHKIPGEYSYESYSNQHIHHTVEGAILPAQIASKIIEPDDIPNKEKNMIIENILSGS